MGQLGFPELIIIALIALLIFGPKKLPELGSGLGKAIKDFKNAMSDSKEDDKAKQEPAPPKPPETPTASKEESVQSKSGA